MWWDSLFWCFSILKCDDIITVCVCFLLILQCYGKYCTTMVFCFVKSCNVMVTTVPSCFFLVKSCNLMATTVPSWLFLAKSLQYDGSHCTIMVSFVQYCNVMVTIVPSWFFFCLILQCYSNYCTIMVWGGGC